MVSVNAQPRLHRGRLLTVIAVMTLLAGVIGIWPSGALGAPTCDVSTLITAFNNANAKPTGTTFASLQAGCTYTLSGDTLYTDSDSAKSGLPELTGGLVLVGNGATVERQSGDAIPNFRIISVSASGRLTLLGVTIQNGSMPGGAGGAIANSGQFTLSDSTVIGNGASGGFGGAIISTGVTRIQRSRVTGNSASIGAGVVNVGGTLTIQSSTIDGNIADFGPGGIYNTAVDTPATTNLIDSTVAGNTALGGAGVTNTSIFNAYNSTIAENSDQGLSNQGGSPDAPATSTLVNTIIAENAGGDCDASQTKSGGIVDNGHNLDSDGTCGLSTATLSLPSTNPLFATVGLADNGGPTPTLAPAAGSPAIDAGDDVVCAADPVNGLDQRGVVRPQGTHCDIGAYELIVPTVTAANATAPFFATSVAFSATVASGCGDSGTYCPVINEGTVTFTVTDSQSNVVGTAGGTVTAGSAAASFNVSGLLPGSYTITAAYHDPSGVFADSQGTSTLTITTASTGHASLTIMSAFTPQVQAMVVTGVNGGTPSGSLSYSSSAVKLSQVRLIGLSAVGSHASVFGTARLADGTMVNFRLDATSARVGGTVQLQLSNGYDSGNLRVLAVRVTP